MALVHCFFIGSSVQKAPVKVFWLILGAGYLAILAHKLIRRSVLKRHPSRVKGVF